MRGITIHADRTRTLRFSINSMIEYKQAKGEDIMAAFAKMEKELDFEFLRYLFYLGLKHEDKGLTEDATGEIMDIILENEGIEYLANILAEAITKAFGIKETPGQSHSKNQ